MHLRTTLAGEWGGRLTGGLVDKHCTWTSTASRSPSSKRISWTSIVRGQARHRDLRLPKGSRGQALYVDKHETTRELVLRCRPLLALRHVACGGGALVRKLGCRRRRRTHHRIGPVVGDGQRLRRHRARRRDDGDLDAVAGRGCCMRRRRRAPGILWSFADPSGVTCAVKRV